MSPSGDDVRRQLDRLLASAGFANAGRMSRFLKFVVEKTLAGEGERLKEYVIGVEVFDRDADYDPRVDSIVRVEAARLRAKLSEYYAGEGRGDALVLSLPKGGYAPAIKVEERATADANGAATEPCGSPRAGFPGRAGHAGNVYAHASAPLGGRRVAGRGDGRSRRRMGAVDGAERAGISGSPCSPFKPDVEDDRTTALASRLTEGVTAELVRVGNFGVVASSAARAARATSPRPRDVAAALEADVLVEARVTSDGERIFVEARSIGPREEKFWVDSFVGTAADSDALERQIAAAIAAAVRTRAQ